MTQLFSSEEKEPGQNDEKARYTQNIHEDWYGHASISIINDIRKLFFNF